MKLKVRKSDGEWYVLCPGCGVGPGLVGLIAQHGKGGWAFSWPSLSDAFDGALDHARREHWTPEVAS